MASFSLSAVRTPVPSSFQVVIGFHHPSFRFLKAPASASPPPFSFRMKQTVRVRLQTRQSSFSTFASNSNPSGRVEEKPDETRTATADAGQGPPFLTILAGLLLFLLICWVVVSILIWLIGFFF